MSLQLSSNNSAGSGAPPRTGRPGLCARLGRLGLATAAITGLAACASEAPTEAPVESQHSAAATVPSAQSFIARPVQRLLLTAKPLAAATDAEAYFKANILPALGRDPRIGDIAIYADPRTGGYIVEAELRTVSPANLSLALDVLGGTQDEARRIINGFARYIDLSSVQQLTARSDLSVSRRILGTIDGGGR